MSRTVVARFIFVSTICLLQYQYEAYVVRTKYGSLRGRRSLAPNGKNVVEFLGVPFAKPPLGDLRFMFPMPPEPWNGTKDATALPNSCVQRRVKLFRLFKSTRLFLNKTNTSEDCLYLNMWIPDGPNVESKLPVMIFFHGGAFFFGTSAADGYDGGVFATEENVIQITVNYRLASLGFLSIGDKEVPGNAGLVDQQMAMQWIHENVANFGGDPGRVTIYGQSAGSASVNFHLVVPSSWDYFQGAILQSGFINVEWALAPKETNNKLATKLAENLGCKRDTVRETVDCLRNVEAEDIIKNEPAYGYTPAVFLPVVDGTWLTEHPFELYLQGKVKKCNLVAGVLKDEGSIVLTILVPTYIPYFVQNPKPKYEAIRALLNLQTNLREQPLLMKMTEYVYTSLEVKENPDYVINALIKIINDRFFVCPMKRLLEGYAKLVRDHEVRLYTYLTTYKLSWVTYQKWAGVYHGSDVSATFGHAFNTVRNRWFHDGKVLPQDVTFTKTVMRYYANFARTGNPNISPSGKTEGIQWPEHTLSHGEYLVLEPNSTKIGWNYRGNSCLFINKLIPELIKEMNITYKDWRTAID